MNNLRYLIPVLLVMLAVLPHYVFADSGNQLDTTLVPNKMIAGTDGIIQVYPKNFNDTVDNLVATSSDSSIVQILGVERDDIHNVFNIKISALNAGQATINMAAPDFASLELPVTIYSDSEAPTALLIKATPQTFSTSGPNAGYVSVETVNSNGVPTPVSSDTPIKLSVSDSTIAGLAENQMTIKQGSYFATEKFVVMNSGNAKIYASAPSMQPVSTSVTVSNGVVQYTLQAYAYPPVVNDHKNTETYVIVQLHDASGNPVIAKNDIPVSVRLVNATDLPRDFESSANINTSDQNSPVQVNDDIVIKKGTYWGYTPVNFISGINATFNVDISAPGYVISTVPTSATITTSITTSGGSTTISSTTTSSGTTSTTATTTGSTTSASGTSTTTSSVSSSSSATNSLCSIPSPFPLSTTQVQIVAFPQNVVLDDKTPCFYPLPILTTGGNNLIGVMALKDSKGYPLIAKSDLSFLMDSSDPSTVSISNVEMGYGAQSALVFAKVGNAANPVTLNVVSDSPQQITPVIVAPSQTTSGLVADSLLATVLPDTTFPLAVYTTNNGALSSFKNDFAALISPQESISPIQLTVTKGEPIFLSDETLLKSGTQNIAITTPDYSSSFTVTGSQSKPSSMMLGYPDQIFSNNALLFSIELLDDKQLPILADKDTDLKLVSSNPSILDVPDNVQIKKGSYYATFDAHSSGSGTAEVAVLADELPLSKFDVSVTSFTPVVSIISDDHADNNSPLTATVTATYNDSPVAGLHVDWTVAGAAIKNKDLLTDKDGKAAISLITDDPNTVKIQASVGGGPYQTVTATKQVGINQPLLPAASPGQTTQGSSQSSSFTVMGLNPILFIIPGAAAAAFLVLKKKNMLEGISERINIAERFSGMMGKTSGSHER
ncbi:MAG: Ig-like domain-containing protein [Thaumarchaeota archaeon]|nr:Ig-like domain-containing protein [Nitrososphaerota archaeon]